MRCGDFLSKAELAALGIDTSRYDEDAAQAPSSAGLRCRFGRVGAAIFRGELFERVMQGQQADLQDGTLEPQEGPALGSESHWTSLGSLLTTDFLSSSKLYAVNLSSTDRASIVKIGHALDAKMYKVYVR